MTEHRHAVAKEVHDLSLEGVCGRGLSSAVLMGKYDSVLIEGSCPRDDADFIIALAFQETSISKALINGLGGFPV